MNRQSDISIKSFRLVKDLEILDEKTDFFIFSLLHRNEIISLLRILSYRQENVPKKCSTYIYIEVFKDNVSSPNHVIATCTESPFSLETTKKILLRIADLLESGCTKTVLTARPPNSKNSEI